MSHIFLVHSKYMPKFEKTNTNRVFLPISDTTVFEFNEDQKLTIYLKSFVICRRCAQVLEF